MKQILAASMALLLCGCSAVYSPHPVGTTPANIQPYEWEGTWLHSDGTFTVKVLDGSNGVLKIGWVGTEPHDLKYESTKIFLREGGGWTFASLEIADASNSTRYIWGKIAKNKNQVVVWGPDLAAFKTVVENDEIPGVVEGGDVHLGELTQQHIEFITAETNGLLQWDEPIAFIKLVP
ncbi:MAG: hypothetical protein KKC51_08825 [Verrucomicrobia bacterium]|nr:hypothetical protein [Verrucomicrobiota bacterium]